MSADLVVNGAAGRMGRLVASELRRCGFTDLVGCDVVEDRNLALADGPFPLARDLVQALRPGGIVVDFSHPAATQVLLDAVQSRRARLVIGTTGQSADEMRRIELAATSVPVVLARNFSLGIHRMLQAITKLRVMIDEGFDLEILETHHSAKRDAPSGTAIMLLEAFWGNAPVDVVHGRSGVDARRKPLEVGVHSVRGGGIPGEHTLLLAGPDEVVEIRHRALSRAAFVSGVPKAVRFVQDHPPGLYSMLDVIGDAE
ncbi:MAG TPA: 4-hydroxy-tetrahydrodipicolinate reductase [Candidatus Krumholzibacteria bacterium]|nr:4-hydroxy-tetrahydrodipicolinate reductase [Candidatus Krumholzibacteria bacterium]